MTYQEALSVLKRIEAEAEDLSGQEVAEAIKLLCERWRETLTGVEMQGVEGAPDWQSFEMRIWQLGESLRLLMKRKRNWRGRGRLLDAVSEIVSEERYGKGRQTFALLLGDFGGGEYGPILAGVLNQPEVAGHAIKALVSARIPGHDEAVSRIADQETGWIRSAAKRYLEILGDRNR